MFAFQQRNIANQYKQIIKTLSLTPRITVVNLCHDSAGSLASSFQPCWSNPTQVFDVIQVSNAALRNFDLLTAHRTFKRLSRYLSTADVGGTVFAQCMKTRQNFGIRTAITTHRTPIGIID